jgi:hypothetical protein
MGISGFSRWVNDIFNLLGCYAPYIGSYLPTFRDYLSANNYQYKLRNIKEQRRHNKWQFNCKIIEDSDLATSSLGFRWKSLITEGILLYAAASRFLLEKPPLFFPKDTRGCRAKIWNLQLTISPKVKNAWHCSSTYTLKVHGVMRLQRF